MSSTKKRGVGRPRKDTAHLHATVSGASSRWLRAQPGGISAALERLVAEARAEEIADIVVSRNPDLLTFLRDIELANEHTRQLAHASARDIEGRVVAGALPLHLACLAAGIIQVDFLASAEERGSLDLEVMRRLAEEDRLDVGIYRVERVG